MPSPFEDENAVFRVLVNETGQYSLWPFRAAIPEGWTVALDEAPLQACHDYVNSHWVDLRRPQGNVRI